VDTFREVDTMGSMGSEPRSRRARREFTEEFKKGAVTANAFSTRGTAPRLGRTLAAEEDRAERRELERRVRARA
jgi:hypothetical protein